MKKMSSLPIPVVRLKHPWSTAQLSEIFAGELPGSEEEWMSASDHIMRMCRKYEGIQYLKINPKALHLPDEIHISHVGVDIIPAGDEGYSYVPCFYCDLKVAHSRCGMGTIRDEYSLSYIKSLEELGFARYQEDAEEKESNDCSDIIDNR